MKDAAVLINSNSTCNRKQSDDRACVGAICRVTSSGLKHGFFYSFPLRLSHRRRCALGVGAWRQTCQPSRFWRDSPAFFTRCPASRKIMEMSRFLYEVGFFCARFVTLPRCPDVNANHPIERNYGNSVRFLAKIPNGTAAESPCYCLFWNAIDFCRLCTSKKKSQCGPCQPSRFLPASPAFLREMSYKNIMQVGRSVKVNKQTLHQMSANS